VVARLEEFRLAILPDSIRLMDKERKRGKGGKGKREKGKKGKMIF